MPKIDFSQVITAEEKAQAALDNLVASIRKGVDTYVEATAQAKGYNGAAHCASYANSTVSNWASEAKAFIAWRDAVWLTVFEMMDDVMAGKRKAPANVDEVVTSLPVIQWP